MTVTWPSSGRAARRAPDQRIWRYQIENLAETIHDAEPAKMAGL
jgi:hypothetical protein